MPAKNTTALTETQKLTIIALRIQGISNRAIAVKMGLHHITVSKAYSQFRRRASQVIDDLGDEWKRDMKILAVRAVKRGLTDGSDIHKSGVLGAQALRGLGELVSGHNVHVEGAVAVTFSWLPTQPPEYPVLEEFMDVETKLVSD
jgi:hypothetical protein